MFAVEADASAICSFRAARPEDARELVESFESVFGQSGVRAPGHDPYPAPEVFTEAGVESIIADPLRDFVVAECNGEIAGAMIVTHNSPYHREFGCVSIHKKFQGKGLSSLMLLHQKVREKHSSLVINTTEIVTHSMLSQAAHHKAGYDKVVGFGYCQYPRVFFAHAPESCLWVSSLEGKVFQWLRKARPAQRNVQSKLPELNPEERNLLSILESPRHCFVSSRYFAVTASLLRQFDDTLTYRLFDEMVETCRPEDGDLTVDLCGSEPYAYLHIPQHCLEQAEFERSWQQLAQQKKRYVQARLNMNCPSTIYNIEFLRQQGFVLLGIAPVFTFDSAYRSFRDVFIMQWIAPEIVSSCPLPGATDAVAKIFGYPLNVSKEIIDTIRGDLRDRDRNAN